MRHLNTIELEAGLDEIRKAPKDNGVLQLIVRRPQIDEREVLEQAELDLNGGLVGDNWKTRGSRRTDDGSAHPDMQLNVMSSRVIDLIAQAKTKWALAGDQLYLDLDISAENLPIGIASQDWLSRDRGYATAAYRVPQIRVAFRSGSNEVCEFGVGKAIAFARSKRKSNSIRHDPCW